MKKISKIILTFLGVFFLLASAVAIFLVVVVNQDTIKNKLIQVTYDTTGRQLAIDGPVNWSFFPWVELRLQDVSLSNVPAFEKGNFVRAGAVNIRIKLMPLLSGHLEAGSLSLEKVDLWLDKKNGPSLSGDLDVNTNLYFDQANDNYVFEELRLSGIIKNKDFEQDFLFNGTLKTKADFLHTMKLNGVLRSARIKFDKFNFKDFSTKIDFNLANDAYVFEELQLSGMIKDKNFEQDFRFNGSLTTKADYLHTMKLNGVLKSDKLEFNKFNFDNFSTKVAVASGLATLSEINFNFYRGSARGFATIDLLKNTPWVNLKLNLDNVMVQPLLIDAANYSKFSGVMNFDVDLNMHGENIEAIQRSLVGQGRLLVANGAYSGLDIPYQIRRAQALINRKPMPQESHPPQTKFDSLTMTYKINNAVLNTNDFLIKAIDYKVTGQGSANIITEQLDMRLNAYSAHDDKFFVPMTVKGYFANPIIRPDVYSIVGNAIKDEVKSQVERQMQKLNIPKNVDIKDISKILPLDKLLH